MSNVADGPLRRLDRSKRYARLLDAINEMTTAPMQFRHGMMTAAAITFGVTVERVRRDLEVRQNHYEGKDRSGRYNAQLKPETRIRATTKSHLA